MCPLVDAYRVMPGADPKPVSLQSAPSHAGGDSVVWIDVAGAPTQVTVDRVGSLDLPLLKPQFVKQAALPVGDVGLADPATAELSVPEGMALVRAFEPVFATQEQRGLTTRPTGEVVARPIIILVGPNWLLTWRLVPLELGASGLGFPLTPRQTLVDVVATAEVGYRASDLARLLLRWMAFRALRVATEVSDTIGTHGRDLHARLLRGAGEPGDMLDVMAVTYDLRTAVDALETLLRDSNPELNSEARRIDEMDGAAPGLRVEAGTMLTRALDLCVDGRRQLDELSVLVSSAQTAALLRAEATAGQRAERLQRMVATVTVVFLGPTLVATIFGASPAWWDDHQELRAGMLALFTALTMFVAALALRPALRRADGPEEQEHVAPASATRDSGGVLRGPHGNPIYELPFRLLRVQINRREGGSPRVLP